MSTHGQGVFTPELRFQWVKGQVTSGTPDEGFVACGDGTAFPMEVTRDQLAEIMYRVRDAKCVSGSVTVSEGFEEMPSFESTTAFNLGALPETLLEARRESDSWISSVRGYCTSSPAETPYIPMEDYDNTVFSSTYYFIVDDIEYRAARDALREYAMWAAHDDADGNFEVAPTTELGFASYSALNVSSFRTGFSYNASTFIEFGDSLPAGHYPYTTLFEVGAGTPEVPYYAAGVALEFDGKVAWIDDDERGDPLSGGNRIFLGARFAINSTKFAADHYFGTDTSTMSAYTAAGADVVLRLSGAGNEVRAPLYFDPSIYGAGYDFAVEEISDWVFEATEWWPYAGEWNPNTGERL